MLTPARLTKRLFGLLAVGLLTGCGGGRAGSSAVPPLGASQAQLHTLASMTAASPQPAAQALFVLNDGNNTVTEYALPAGTLLSTVNLTPPIRGGALAANASGDFFLWSGTLQHGVGFGNNLTEYAPPYTAAPITVDNIYVPNGLAVSASGALFAASYANCNVTEYAPPYSNSQNTVITTGGYSPEALALDAAGDLFVASVGIPCSGPAPAPPVALTITEYAPPSYQTAKATINLGAASAGEGIASLAVDVANNLFVDAVVANGNSTITEYAPPYSGPPLASLSLANAGWIAANGSGNLFASTSESAVTEYSMPSGKTIATISQGVNGPQGLAVGPETACPVFYGMQNEAKQLTALANTLQQSDSAYMGVVADMRLRGYDSEYARLGLLTPEKNIPAFLQNAELRRGVIVSVIREKAARRAEIAAAGLAGGSGTASVSEDTLHYFCTLDPTLIDHTVWEDLEGAGYIDYPLFAEKALSFWAHDAIEALAFSPAFEFIGAEVAVEGATSAAVREEQALILKGLQQKVLVNEAEDASLTAASGLEVIPEAVTQDISITPTQWKHVIKGHFFGTQKGSQFSISPDALEQILQSENAIQSPVVRTFESKDWNVVYVREFKYGETVGVDKFTQSPTSIITIWTAPDGSLVTAFPGVKTTY